MAQSQTGRPQPSQTMRVTAAILGNALEFYDFLIFSIFAVQIGQAFFPSTNPVNSLLAALATIGAANLKRKLLASVYGHNA
jgi:hypothetical protein